MYRFSQQALNTQKDTERLVTKVEELTAKVTQFTTAQGSSKIVEAAVKTFTDKYMHHQGAYMNCLAIKDSLKQDIIARHAWDGLDSAQIDVELDKASLACRKKLSNDRATITRRLKVSISNFIKDNVLNRDMMAWSLRKLLQHLLTPEVLRSGSSIYRRQIAPYAANTEAIGTPCLIYVSNTIVNVLNFNDTLDIFQDLAGPDLKESHCSVERLEAFHRQGIVTYEQLCELTGNVSTNATPVTRDRPSPSHGHHSKRARIRRTPTESDEDRVCLRLPAILADGNFLVLRCFTGASARDASPAID